MSEGAGFLEAPVEAIASNDPRAIAIGPFGSALKSDQYTDSGVPVLRGQDITVGDALNRDGRVFVPKEVAERFPACVVSQGDLVFPHRGAIGRVGIVGEEDWLLSSSMMKLSVDQERFHSKYVFYYFRGPGKRQLLERASTVGTPGIGQPLASLKSVVIRFPELAQQRAIAEVLGAFDDKIAANSRLVSTLLQLVEARFATAAAHSTLSDQTFADVAAVGGGGTPKTKVEEYWGDEINWATPTDVTALHGPYLNSTSRRISQAGLDNCSSALYPTGSILMTSRATIGAFAVAQTPMAVNQGFIVVNSKGEAPQWWLFHEMQRRVPEFVSHANGATFLELSRGKFKNFHVHLAAAEVMQGFAETAEALHNRAAAAEMESASLATTRDTLLPLLMSGRVTVKDAESVVEGVA